MAWDLCLLPHPLLVSLTVLNDDPLKQLSFSLLSTTTHDQSIDRNSLCCPLKLAFGEEFRAFPISLLSLP